MAKNKEVLIKNKLDLNKIFCLIKDNKIDAQRAKNEMRKEWNKL